MSTLSVEISTTVSSARTGSPGCLAHSRMVPSVTDSPAGGATMSTVRAAADGASASAWPPDPLPCESTWPDSCWAASAAAGVPAGASPSSDTAASAVGGAAPLVVISARTAPTSTVSPSAAWIFVILPAAGAGTSASTLSVEISTIVSSAATASPSCLCHSRIVPSVTESPIWGMVTCTVVLTAISPGL